MTTYYRNEYLFSEIYLQEITQQPEDTEIVASLTTLKEYREFARTATIQEWKESFVHEVLYALRFNIKIENESLTLLYPVGNMETPLTLCYALLPTEDLDNTTMGRNWAEKVIRSLRHHNLKWGLLTNGEQWRMYHLDESTPYEIFLEINLAAIMSDSASQAYQIFHKFMKVENFTADEQGQCRLDIFKKESLAKIDYIESELANALKQKEEGGKGVLSNLCMGYVDFLKAGGSRNFDDEALRRKIYHGAMLYMFRLLFLFYADARGLLNETNSSLLKDVLRRSKASSANNTSASSYSIWEDLERIFVDIDQSYNGGLFDPHESEFTQFIEESRVNNSHLASALHYLTSYQERSGEEKAISYRDMSVRHLGTLYEGLLEHKLFITKEDTEVRAAKDKIQFIPASQGGKIVAGRYIPAGQVYFGSDRSERKATGSYYTPEYIVDYNVRNTVGEKLSQLRQDFLAGQKDLLIAVGKAIAHKERKALTELLEDNLKTFIKEKVLKLSVLDLAMGSGHFLVNTSNCIANFITEILNEFEIIGTTETSTTYWRRWVVENCVYGVDVNPLAVELAKLSLWILSMSKENPLSFLNHNLKTGNSLIGARLDDIGKYPGKGDKKQHSIFSDDQNFKEAVGKAISNYIRITSTDSASLDAIADKKAWLDEIDDILKPYKLICDLHTSIYFGNEISEWKYKELIDKKDIGYSNLPSYFHWELEFLQLFGHDELCFCIIGNPPWGGELNNDEKTFLISAFDHVHMRTPETANYFLAKADSLISYGSYIGMIIPNNFLFQHEFAKARKYYVEKTGVEKAVNLGDSVFKVTAPSCIVIFQKYDNMDPQNRHIYVADYREVEREELPSYLADSHYFTIKSSDILSSPDYIIPMSKSSGDIIKRVFQNVPELMDDLCNEVAAGIGTGGDKIFRISNTEAKANLIEQDILRPLLIGREIHPYYVPAETGYSIIYATKAVSKISHPNTLQYLMPFEDKLSQKRETRKGLIPWWSLHWPRYPGLFQAPKIVLRQTADTLCAAIDSFGYYCLNSIIIVHPKNQNLLKYYVGLLNSRLMRWLYRNLTQEQSRVFAEVKPVNLRKLPIRQINFSSPADKKSYDDIVSLVDIVMNIQKRKYENPGEQLSIDNELEMFKEIDALVYKLYDLSKEDISVIEEKSK